MKRAALLAALVIALVLLAHPFAGAENLGSDPFANVSGHTGNGLIDRYPLSAYSLDTHIDSSVLPGSSWGEEAAGFVTSILWTITAWLVKTIIGLVVMAFSLDLLGSGGALAPVAKAIRSIHDHVLGDPWMVMALSAAGFWALWKGVIQRRHSEAASSLALSVVFVLIAMFLVFKPVETVGQVASWTNDVSTGFLVGTNTGSLNDPEKAKQRIADELFRTQVVNPWAILNFGGLKHCVDGTHRDKDGYPRPVAPDDPDRTACRDHMKVVNGMGGYAPRFLRQPPGSAFRKMEYNALRDGEIPGGPVAGATDQFRGYHVDKTDSPAVDIQQSGSAYNRMVLALTIFAVSMGFVVLFGLLAVAIILAQIAALLILAFSPVVLLAAVIPGRGHQLFVAWGGKLLTALVIKAFYCLVISVLIAVSAALTSATTTIGWLYAFGLLGAFYAMVFVKRKWMAEKLVSQREYRKSERSVEKTAAAATGMVAAPFVTLAGLAASKGKQESAVGGQTPAQTSSIDQQAQETAPSEAKGPIRQEQAGPGPVPSSEGVRPAAPSQVPEPRTVESVSSGGAEDVSPGLVATPLSAPSRPPAVPASPEGQEAQRTNLPLANGKPQQPPEPEFPGLGTPESVVGPQRRYPKVEDLAPPTEYRGP